MPKVQLQKVAKITMGTSPKGDTYNSDCIGLPLLNGPTEFGEYYPNCNLFTTESIRECQRGDLIFCVRGSTTGRMNWADKTYSLGRGVCSIRGESLLDTMYIKYFLDDKLTTLLKYAGGGTFPNLTKDTIFQFEIEYPENRKKISAILCNYDTLIDNNTRRVNLLEQMAKLIYDEWFVKFKFPEHEKARMVDSELGKIPEGWELKQIGDLFEVVLGGTPSRIKKEFWGGSVPWVNSGKVNELRIVDESEFITDLGLNRSATKMMPRRTTILAITGATLGQVSLTEIEVCANQSVVGIYDKDNLYSEYIYLKINELIKDIIMKAGGGAQQHINKEIVSQTEMLLPIKEIVIHFVKIIRPIFDEIANLLFSNKNLKVTRDILLPKLISGQIDVSELEIRVPEVKV